jgi:tetratricopeptide (TPR) repeat protein
LQRIFVRLSVFRGGWTVEAAEAVCEASSALDYLEQLRDCSLVVADESAAEMRYRVLETLREYAAEQLAGEERDGLARRHAQWFLALAETAERKPAPGDRQRWLNRLEREHDNLNAALVWATQSGDIDLGLRLACALEEFWFHRGYLREGRDLLLRLLAHPAAAAPTKGRARALSVAGRLAGLGTYQDEFSTAPRRLHVESLAIWRALGDGAGISAPLLDVAMEEGDLTSAQALVEESLAIRRELGDAGGIADALACLAGIRRQAHDLSAARALLEECLSLSRAVGDRVRIHNVLGDLGDVTLHLGDAERARALIRESLAVSRELDDRAGIAWALMRLGYVAHRQEEYAAARALFEQCLPLWRELERSHGLVETLFHLAHLRQQEGDYTGAYATFELMWAAMREGNSDATGPFALLGLAAADLGRWDEAAAHCSRRLQMARSPEPRHPHIIAWAVIGMARVALARARPARAARLLGAVPALLAASHIPWWPSDHATFDRAVSAVHAQLAEVEFAAAWAEGQTMPLEAAIAEALEEAPTA